jgi:hypothetical protein
VLVQEIFCPALAALVGPVQNIFFLSVLYFNAFVPIAQQAGQSVVQGRLSLNMCLRVKINNSAGKNKVSGLS